MSEQPSAIAESSAPRPPGSKGALHLGLTNRQWMIAGGAGVAALAYLLWRKRKAAAAAGTSQAGQSAQDCVDSQGNPVPCSATDFAGQLSAIESELQTLQAAQASGAASGGGSGGGGWGGSWEGSSPSGSASQGTTQGTTDTGAANPGDSSGGSSSGGSSSGGSSSGGSSSAASGRLSVPTGVHLTIRGRTGVRVQWNAVSGAVGYVAQCKRGGDNGTVTNGPFSISGPVANFGGLQAGTGYTALIWPSSAQIKGGPGSNQPHAEFGFTTT